KYPWPGNIRELQNVIERAAILTNGPVLKVPSDDLRAATNTPPQVLTNGSAQSTLHTKSNGSMRATLDIAERQQILAALEQANWKVAGPNGAASLLGMKRSTLQSRMQKLDIRISRTGA